MQFMASEGFELIKNLNLLMIFERDGLVIEIKARFEKWKNKGN